MRPNQTLIVTHDHQTLSIAVEFKPKRHLSISVRPDLTVIARAPLRQAMDEVERFVRLKTNWIFKSLKQLQAAPHRTPQKLSAAELAQAAQLFEERISHYFPPFAARGYVRPKLRLRCMKSRWGSCRKGTGAITLNTELFKTPPGCLDYVVVHELCHLVHGNHGKRFWALVERMMPDYRERKRRLHQWRRTFT